MRSKRLQRREFITLLGGAAAAWPVVARAQQAAMPVIGYLYAGSADASTRLTAASPRLERGRNVAIEYRFADSAYNRLPELAADLVRRRVAVIVTPSSVQAARAAKSETVTIPIVFQTGADPVQVGLVASLNRPGGNATGIASMNTEISSKRLGLLHELVPTTARLAVLVNPQLGDRATAVIAEARAAAAAMKREIEPLSASNNDEIDAAFAALAQKRIGGIMVTASPLFSNRRVQLAMATMRHGIPAIYTDREIVEAGGLMSYASNLIDEFRQVGIYAGRVLKGEKPADLPVLRASKFEFVINLQSAKLLGIEIPDKLLALADEVIE
jgi:putative ABC transport system substrate-binding protein